MEKAFIRACDPVDWVAAAGRADPDVDHVDTGGQDYARVTFKDGSYIVVQCRSYEAER